MRHQVAPQHLELLAVLKTYNVIGLDRCADRDGRLLFDFRCFDIAKTCKRFVQRSDDQRNIRYSDTVVAHMRGNNIRRERAKRLLIFHFHLPRSGSEGLMVWHESVSQCRLRWLSYSIQKKIKK